MLTNCGTMTFECSCTVELHTFFNVFMYLYELLNDKSKKIPGKGKNNIHMNIAPKLKLRISEEA